MSGMSLADLRAVSVLARTGSFRGTAKELEVSVSSLSHQVANVEKRLGIRLFNRTTRSVSVTEAGEALLERVRPALNEIDAALEAVDQLRATPSGTIRLNTSEGGAERVLPLVLDFLRTYPDIKIDLVTDGRLVDIVAEGFDAGLRLHEIVPKDMISVPLGQTESFVLVASPDYLQGKKIPTSPGDLLQHECVRARLPSGTLVTWELEKNGEAISVDVKGRLIAGSTELSVLAARQHAGIAYVALRAVRDDIVRGDLVQLLPEWTPPYPGIALFYPSRRLPSAALRAFIDHTIAWRKHHQE
ncbi:LysR family transcriptional regulator [Agrobacterium tumefaciens]|uniref:LysR family transcriptional regulator n=1 Tax=Agrobacterium tumefaciens TaxID=358 RepID=UPI00287C2B1A|nr:LysR family transcriptional regulator [Agrobacterium tumefaciens]MDS7598483.1 LysR family transcriptional regulator [Agrobacterium tumefaciens]